MSEQYKPATARADYYIGQFCDRAVFPRQQLFDAHTLYRGEHIFAMVWHRSLYCKVDDGSPNSYEADNSPLLAHTLGAATGNSLKIYTEVPFELIVEDDKQHQWDESACHAVLKNGR